MSSTWGALIVVDLGVTEVAALSGLSPSLTGVRFLQAESALLMSYPHFLPQCLAYSRCSVTVC